MGASFQDIASTVVVVTGATTAVIGVLDWSLSPRAKKIVKSSAETAWIWLSYQRAGPYLDLVKARNIQVGLVWIAISLLIMITILHAMQTYTGLNFNASLNVGQLRLFKWQIWVDIGALAIMGGVVTTRLHPRVMAWTASRGTVGSYLRRTWGALGLTYVAGFVALLPFVIPLMIIMFDLPDQPVGGGIDEAKYRRVIIDAVGGVVPAISIHALSAFLLAPIVIQMWLLLVIAALSLYWSAFVLLVSAIFKAMQFALGRVVSYDKGPLLGISALAVALGAAAKLLVPAGS